MKKNKPTALIILDGFGYSAEKKYNAIHLANPKNFNHWLNKFPHAILQASGKYVGLPDGFIGNSEVGHLTIGSGKITKEPITILLEEIENGEFLKNKSLINKIQKLASSNHKLHLLGLLSNAGVHGHEKIILETIKLAAHCGVKKIFLHAFLDGRDVPPKSASIFLEHADNLFNQLGCGEIGSISGRFYAMDRDQNWQRTQKTYDMLVAGNPKFNSWQDALQFYYDQKITDEFIPPTLLNSQARIENEDGIIFCNTRADRARQLTEALLDKEFEIFPAQKINFSFFITGISYREDFKTTVLCEKEKVGNTILDVLQKHKKTIFTIAETEKYAHVTYFFNGGKEIIRPGETRILIHSIPREQYIDLPQMSAEKITQTVLYSLNNTPLDFYLINYANADMVGHSGDLEATIKAIKVLDHELELLYKKIVQELDGTMYITADHGNAEEMFDAESGQPKTRHTTNPVYFLMLQKELEGKNIELNLHELKDIAPFILKNMSLATPPSLNKK